MNLNNILQNTISKPTLPTLKMGLLMTIITMVCGFLPASQIHAAAVVESRTGTPTVAPVTSPQFGQTSSGQTMQQGAPSGNMGHSPQFQSSAAPRHSAAEDRAARMTLSQIESLQKEVGDLRGLVETQEHEIKQLKKSQQDLYLDLDRRLNQLNQKTAGAISAAKNSKPAAASASAAAHPSSHSPTPAKGSTAAAASTTKAVAATAAALTPKVATTMAGATASAGAIAPAPSAHASPSSYSSSVPVSSSVTAASSATTVKKTTSSSNSKENEAYQAAYSLVRTKRYPEAISALEDYLNHHPKGENAAAAHYWLGEVYMVQWQAEKSNPELLDKASTEFSNLSSQFSAHPKAGDALLKLGIIEAERGNLEAAEGYFNQVKTDYAGTAAARIAETRLQQMAAD